MGTTRGHVEPSLVVTQGRRKDSSTAFGRSHLQLRGSIERMTDELPVDEVGRAIYGNPGKVLKSRGRQVVRAIHKDDRGVGVETAENGITILYGRRGHDRGIRLND